MAVAATLLSHSDADHIDAVLSQIDCTDWRFIGSRLFAGRIDPTERNFWHREEVCVYCVRLDASRAFRAGSACVCP